MCIRDRLTPVRSGSDSDWTSVASGFQHTCGLRRDGRLRCWGDGATGQLGTGDLALREVPTLVMSEATFTSVAAGIGHTCALETAGRVRCWGDGGRGQIGDGGNRARSSPTGSCLATGP